MIKSNGLFEKIIYVYIYIYILYYIYVYIYNVIYVHEHKQMKKWINYDDNDFTINNSHG